MSTDLPLHHNPPPPFVTGTMGHEAKAPDNGWVSQTAARKVSRMLAKSSMGGAPQWPFKIKPFISDISDK